MEGINRMSLPTQDKLLDPTPPSRGKDTSPEASREHQPVVGVKYFTFAFYQMLPSFRQLPAAERERLVEAFCGVVQSEKTVHIKSYSTIGLRRDTDFFFWLTSPLVADLQALQAKFYQTGLINYLSLTYNYLAMVKPSPYFRPHTHEAPPIEGDPKYAFVYPFVKTREWYAFPFEERMGMMKEHTQVGHDFPTVKINTSYSFGIDDQEFTLCFESDFPDHFVNLVQKLRETRASRFTLRDTPMFIGALGDLRHILREAGGI